MPDYFNICITEGADFYSDVYAEDNESFNRWVQSKLVMIQKVEGIAEVQPSLKESRCWKFQDALFQTAIYLSVGTQVKELCKTLP